MPSHKTRLAAKVAARNHVHAIALAHAPAMIDALRPFVGKKVTTVDGGLTAKVRKALPPDVPTGESYNGVLGSYYSTGHGYTITAMFKVCHSAPLRHGSGEGAEYADATVYLGDLQNGILTKLYDAPTLLRTDYTEGEVIDARAELEAAKRAVSAAQAKLHYFGEYET